MKQVIRVFHNFEFDDLKAHTLEYGALSGMCSNCKNLDVKIDSAICPKCGTSFDYIAFQSVKEHMPKLLRLMTDRPSVKFIDYQDFKRIEGEVKARSIFG